MASQIALFILYPLTIIFTLLVIILFFEVIAGLMVKPKPIDIDVLSEKGKKLKSVLLIPAHNEALIIDKTLSSLKEQLTINDSILVIADNCTDNTEEILQGYEVTTLVRQDTCNLGKGFALDYGVRHLEQTNTDADVVVIIDADCDCSHLNLQALKQQCFSSGNPIQSRYDMQPDGRNSLSSRISSFAWLLKNHIRASGASAMGFACQLMGSGMVFPWSLLKKMHIATGALTEDLLYGLETATLGKPNQYFSHSVVTSSIPSRIDSAKVQKERWIHGHLQVIIKDLLKFLFAAIKKANLRAVIQILDASIPPITLLILMVFLLGLTNFALFSNSYLQLYSALSTTLIILVLSITWLLRGRQLLSFKEIIYMPIYIMLKIPLYWKFLYKRQKVWIKTDRELTHVEPTKNNGAESLLNLLRAQKYLLISPCRDEEEFMRTTLDSVVNQTILPTKWVIVDDGSTDSTPEILAEYAKQYDFIEVITRENRGKRKVGPGVIEAFYTGLNAVDMDDYDYLCKLDLDLELPAKYFETLLVKMINEPRQGTYSGKAYYINDFGDFVSEKCGDESSVGMTKFYRVSCFKQIGGFVRQVMWDGIDSHRCRLLGWISSSDDLPNLRFTHLRPMGSSEQGIMTGRMRHGFGQYFMGTSLTYMLASTVYRLAHPPYIIGSLASLWGYIKSNFKGVQRFDDKPTLNIMHRFHRLSLLMGKRRALEKIHSERESCWDPLREGYSMPRYD